MMVRDWDCFAWAVESVALVREYDIHMPLPNMRTALKIGWLLVGTCVLFTIRPIWAAESPREHVSLDANWRFHLGDDWPDALHLDKAGTGSGAAAAEFAAELTGVTSTCRTTGRLNCRSTGRAIATTASSRWARVSKETASPGIAARLNCRRRIQASASG